MMTIETDIAKLYRQHVTMLRHSCRRILGDPQLAEDVTQEAFIQYMEYARTHAVEAPGAVLYRIATRTAIKRLRTRKGLVQINEALTADHRTQPMDVRIALTEVFNAVDEEEAQVALMHFVEGLTHDEIAEVMEVSRRTVGNRLERFCRRAEKISALRGQLETGPELRYDLAATAVKKPS